MKKYYRFLVMDDDPRVCASLADYLGQFGYQVDCAARTEHAIDLLARGSYDGLLLDAINEPRGGHPVLRWLKRHERHEPVIMMSDWADEDMWVDLVSQGAVDLLSKPIKSQPLEQALGRAVYAQILLYATCVANHQAPSRNIVSKEAN